MASPEPVPVVISCPHCGTRYQVPYASIGPKGRNVLCAHCGQSWQAKAEAPPRPEPPPKPRPVVDPDKNLQRLAEEMLDEKFVLEERRHKAKHDAALRAEAEARAKAKGKPLPGSDEAAIAQAAERAAAIAGNPPPALSVVPAATADSAGEEGAEDGTPRPEEQQGTVDETKSAIETKPSLKVGSATHRKVQQEFSKRQRTAYSKLPVARLRRYARFASLATVVGGLGLGVWLRGPIVQQFPQLAGAYAAIGLGVNVVGMEFRDVHTLLSLQEGTQVLAVDGKIASVASHGVPVPPVIVTLLGSDGASVYQWSMTPEATELEPGETVGFETQLSKPPAAAKQVRLSFANGPVLPRPKEAASAGDQVDTVPDDAPPAPETGGAAVKIELPTASDAGPRGVGPAASHHIIDNGTTNNGQNPAR